MIKANMIRNIADGAHLTGNIRADAIARMSRNTKQAVQKLYALYRQNHISAQGCVALLTYKRRRTKHAPPLGLN